MPTEMKPFLFEAEHMVRMLTKDNDPWFIATDVCKVLGLSNPSVALQALDADEKMTLSLTEGHSGQRGGAQSQSLISESGLYTLILRCRNATKPGTVQHRFRKWVTSEVLPSIRKTGAYVHEGDVLPPMSEQVQDISLNLRTVTETRQSFGCKASQQMWFKLGLPTVPAMFDGQQFALALYEGRV